MHIGRMFSIESDAANISKQASTNIQKKNVLSSRSIAQLSQCVSVWLCSVRNRLAHTLFSGRTAQPPVGWLYARVAMISACFGCGSNVSFGRVGIQRRIGWVQRMTIVVRECQARDLIFCRYTTSCPLCSFHSSNQIIIITIITYVDSFETMIMTIETWLTKVPALSAMFVVMSRTKC